MSDYEDNAVDFSNVDWDDEQKKTKVKSGALKKVDVVGDLLKSIQSSKNLDGIKKQLKVGHKKKKIKTLDAPLHRQAKRRIESNVAYQEAKKDLKVWNEVVFENRIAEQITYPLNPEDNEALRVERAADKVKGFIPRTELERQMAEVLGKSKNNLKNDDMYTEAEKEIIKAMSLKEARAKCQELQNTRRLMSYQEAKFRRQAKIKSKQYHRIKKRQERRNQIKEFEELLAKDPEKAKEKLLQLQTDRAYERATLRHRGQNKWSRALKQYASRNPELQKMVAEHLKFGRELKSKLGKNLEEGFSSTDEEDPEMEQKAKLTMEEIMKMAAEEAKREAEDEASKKIENVNDNPWLKDSVAKLRAKKAALRDKMQISEEHFEALREEGGWNAPDFEVPDDSFNASLNDLIKEKPKEDNVGQHDVKEQDDEEIEEPVQKKKTLKKKKKLLAKKKVKKADNDEDENVGLNKVQIKNLFEEVEDLILNHALKPKNSKKAAAAEDSEPAKKRNRVTVEEQTLEEEPKAQTIDLHKYLQTTTAVNTVIPEAMEAYLEEAENQDVSHDNLLAEAFADDDVVDEFEEKKRRIEGDENPIEEDVDITLMGWGSWTGPGTEEMTEKKKQKMTRKPKDKPKRKDGRLAHVIIRENVENPIEKLQPKEIPFPFTRAQDYEALIRQPIGREWNPVTHTAILTRPEVVAPAGRIIRPMERSILAQRKANEVSTDEEDN